MHPKRGALLINGKNMNDQCTEIFNQRKSERTHHPMPFGRYKLKEALDRLKRDYENIDDMMGSHNDTFKPKNYTCCTDEDKAIWLKKVPNGIAERFGWEVIPSIDALIGDGITTSEINKIKSIYVPRIENLVNDCEKTRRKISKNIDIEYNNWKKERSDIQPLLNESISIVEEILTITNIEE